MLTVSLLLIRLLSQIPCPILNIFTRDDLHHICDVTGCYAAWRAQEEEKHTQKNNKAKFNAEFSRTNSPTGSGKTLSNTAGKSNPLCCQIPLDCIAVGEITVTLQGGYGEVGNIILPLDTPPGKYVIEVSDGILPACLRTPAPDINLHSNLVSSSSSLTGTERSAVPTSSVRTRAALEDLKNLAAVANPIRINRQTIFNAIPATVSSA